MSFTSPPTSAAKLHSIRPEPKPRRLEEFKAPQARYCTHPYAMKGLEGDVGCVSLNFVHRRIHGIPSHAYLLFLFCSIWCLSPMKQAIS